MDTVSLVFALAFLYLSSYQLQLGVGGWGKGRKEAEETVPYLKRDLGDMKLAVAHLKLDPTCSVGVCGVLESEWETTNPLVILTCAPSPASLLEQVITRFQKVKSQNFREQPRTLEKVNLG